MGLRAWIRHFAFLFSLFGGISITGAVFFYLICSIDIRLVTSFLDRYLGKLGWEI